MCRPFGERRGTDRSGLGLGLSIARKAVRAHYGDILVHNMPGRGCVFARRSLIIVPGRRVSELLSGGSFVRVI
jgi:K+-sensing histidine kinase KdpD